VETKDELDEIMDGFFGEEIGDKIEEEFVIGEVGAKIEDKFG
jgi:hypothetical protein